MKIRKGYYVVGATGERSSGKLRGPYSEYNAAKLACKSAAWYGGDGEVESYLFLELLQHELINNSHSQLYEIVTDEDEELFFIDETKNYKQNILTDIIKKLDPEELEILKEMLNKNEE